MLASGFTGSPVTQCFFFGIIASSILVSISDTKHLFHIQIVPHIWQYRQFWRLLTWQTCYTNSTSLLFATMTMYQLRVVERLWGSRKFASFLISIAPLALILPPVLLALFLRPLSLNALNALPAGPTPLLFALLAQYHDAIPTVYKYRLALSSPSNSTDQLTLLLTDKSIHYLLAAQLALSSLPGSLIAAGIGWSVGIAWRRDIGPGVWAKWRVPKAWGGRKREGEGFEGLRRRLEGDSTGTSIEGVEGEARRRTLGGGILDQFRGAF